MFVEYSKEEIIDKINVFFGYKFIKEIRLILIKEKMKKVKKYNFDFKEKNELKRKVNKISNSNLKQNLTNLINVFSKKK